MHIDNQETEKDREIPAIFCLRNKKQTNPALPRTPKKEYLS